MSCCSQQLTSRGWCIGTRQFWRRQQRLDSKEVFLLLLWLDSYKESSFWHSLLGFGERELLLNRASLFVLYWRYGSSLVADCELQPGHVITVSHAHFTQHSTLSLCKSTLKVKHFHYCLIILCKYITCILGTLGTIWSNNWQFLARKFTPWNWDLCFSFGISNSSVFNHWQSKNKLGIIALHLLSVTGAWDWF